MLWAIVNTLSVSLTSEMLASLLVLSLQETIEITSMIKGRDVFMVKNFSKNKELQ
ncbi:MAG: hypothetical protein ACI9KI_001194 [Patiriisocius sp.]|jgi:hypothetical protein